MDKKDLTPRQRQVLRLRLRGKSYTEIGRELGITSQAVAQVVTSLRRKEML